MDQNNTLCSELLQSSDIVSYIAIDIMFVETSYQKATDGTQIFDVLE